MIDLHSHILPGLDDGCASIEETIGMAQWYVQQGFTKVVATPHVPGYGLEPLLKTQILDSCDFVNHRLQHEQLPLKVFPGAEIVLDPMVLAMKDDCLVPLGNNANKLLLIEYPWQMNQEAHTLLFNLRQAGYKILLAHPERSPMADVDHVDKMVQAGDIFVQLELGSFLGIYGKDVYVKTMQLLERGVVHIVSTDLHKVEKRGSDLQASLDFIEKSYGEQNKTMWLCDNPQHLLNGNFMDVRSGP